MHIKIKAEKKNITKAVKFVDKELNSLKVSKSERIYTVLSVEEIIMSLIENSDSKCDLKIDIRKILGNIKIKLACNGAEIDSKKSINQIFKGVDLNSEEAEIVDSYLKTINNHIEFKRHKKTNICIVNVKKSKYSQLYITLSCLVLGTLCGLLLKQAPYEFADALKTNLFIPVYTLFINALKFIIGPLVFFSIANSIVGFANIKALGRIALKVITLYVLTSLIAICVGFVSTVIFPIGDASLQSAITDSANSTIEKTSQLASSPISMIVGIVPANIISPFLEANMLQVIFIAILIGIASSFVDSNSTFSNFIKSGTKVFLRITSFIIKVLPVAIFCSMAKMMIDMNLSEVAKILLWVPGCYIGHFLMLVTYATLLLILARYNPFKFFKLYLPAMITAFSTGSSSASLPVSLKMCDESLKISPKVYAFSIPMGSTINMDGCCVTLVVTLMFVARIFNMEITPTSILTVVLTIMLLSMGEPGVPGSNLICAAVLLPTVGLPAEAISLIMGVYPLVGMSQTTSNVTGDAVVTIIVAKSENLIDNGVFTH